MSTFKITFEIMLKKLKFEAKREIICHRLLRKSVYRYCLTRRDIKANDFLVKLTH